MRLRSHLYETSLLASRLTFGEAIDLFDYALDFSIPLFVRLDQRLFTLHSVSSQSGLVDAHVVDQAIENLKKCFC